MTHQGFPGSPGWWCLWGAIALFLFVVVYLNGYFKASPNRAQYNGDINRIWGPIYKRAQTCFQWVQKACIELPKRQAAWVSMKPWACYTKHDLETGKIQPSKDSDFGYTAMQQRDPSSSPEPEHPPIRQGHQTVYPHSNGTFADRREDAPAPEAPDHSVLPLAHGRPLSTIQEASILTTADDQSPRLWSEILDEAFTIEDDTLQNPKSSMTSSPSEQHAAYPAQSQDQEKSSQVAAPVPPSPTSHTSKADITTPDLQSPKSAPTPTPTTLINTALSSFTNAKIQLSRSSTRENSTQTRSSTPDWLARPVVLHRLSTRSSSSSSSSSIRRATGDESGMPGHSITEAVTDREPGHVLSQRQEAD